METDLSTGRGNLVYDGIEPVERRDGQRLGVMGVQRDDEVRDLEYWYDDRKGSSGEVVMALGGIETIDVCCVSTRHSIFRLSPSLI